jgi:hypothetical protein
MISGGIQSLALWEAEVLDAVPPVRLADKVSVVFPSKSFCQQ